MTATATDIQFRGRNHSLIRATITGGPTRTWVGQTFTPGHANVTMHHGHVHRVIVYWHGTFTWAHRYNPGRLPGWLRPVVGQMVAAWEVRP